MKRRSLLGLALGLGAGLWPAACGSGGKLPPVTLRAPVSSASSATKTSGPPPVVLPALLAGVSLGSFAEGTFGPRVVRNGASSIVVSAPRAATGRRWMAVALDAKGAPLADAQHELAEAPEDASAWDVKPIGEGFVLAWTRPTDSGEQLLSVALAPDGSPRTAPMAVAKSGDDLVAVRLVPLSAGGDGGTPSQSGGALLTWGEKSIPKGAIAATGTLHALALDTLGRPTSASTTKIAEKLSAWQVTALSPTVAIVALVERNDPKGGKDKDPALAAREDLSRSAKAMVITLGAKGLTMSDAVTLATDDVVPEIDVVATSAHRALVVWSDRREIDAHLFAAPVEVTGGKPKLGAPARRTVPARGDQALVSLVATSTGVALLYETVTPRSLKDPRRRFDVARLSPDGDVTTTPRAFAFPYENDEPELARADMNGDDVALLTYGAACMTSGSAPVTCDAKDLRPYLVRLGGPTFAPKQAEMLAVSAVGSAPALHAFDLACDAKGCRALVEGQGTPATVAMAEIPVKLDAKPDAPRWVYSDFIETSKSPPRLEGASAVGREAEFTGLHAARAGTGTIVAWITYAPDDVDVDTAPPLDTKSDKDPKKKSAPKKKSTKAVETGARVAVRLLDGAGEPLAPIALVSDKALSKGDVAVAWSALSDKEATKDAGGGVVAYVGRVDGDEEVFVAKIDAKGSKTGKSTRITKTPGIASDVALTVLPEGGYLLAWIDARNDAPAVYAVRLDKGGQKVGNEQKIGGGAAGDLADLSIATIGSGTGGARVLAAWSDARADATHGYGDIWYTVLGTKDLAKPVIGERAIAKTKPHSHYAMATARGDGGGLIAWIEDDPSSSEFLELSGRADFIAVVARIDGNGAIVQALTELVIDPSAGKGVATGIAADCPSGPSSCRVAIAWATREGIEVLGTTLTATPAPARPFWSWFGAPSQEVSPAIVGTVAFVCEDGLERDDGRVRRLSVAW